MTHYVLQSLRLKTKALGKKDLSDSGKSWVKAQFGTQYQVIDEATGLPPKKLALKKKGANLIVEVDGEHVATIRGFYADTHAEPPASYRVDDSCSLESTQTQTQSDDSTTSQQSTATNEQVIMGGAGKGATAQSADGYIWHYDASKCTIDSPMPAIEAAEASEGLSRTQMIGLGLGAVLIGGGAAAGASSGGGGGSGGGSGGGGSTTPPVPDLVIQGTVTGGPMFAGIVLEARDNQGNLLASTTIGIDGTYYMSVSRNGAYRGAVLVTAVDENGHAINYLDEVTGTNKSLGVNLRGLGVANDANTSAFVVGAGGNTQLTINISILSELAVRQVLGNNAWPMPVTTDSIITANKNIAKAFGVASNVDITTVVPTATNAPSFNGADGLSNAERIGIVLAKLSGLDAINGGNVGVTIEQLSATLTGDALTLAGAALVDQGRAKALAAVKATNSTTFNAGSGDSNTDTTLNRQLLGDAVISSQTLDNNGKLIVSGTALPGSIVIVTLPDGTKQTATANSSGQFSLISVNPQPNLSQPLEVQSQDALSQPVFFEPPAAPVIAANNGHVVSGSGTPGSTVTVMNGSIVVGTAVVDALGNWSMLVPSSVTVQSTDTLTATAVDPNGNYSGPGQKVVDLNGIASQNPDGTDGYVNATEKLDGVAVDVYLPAGAQVGDVVTTVVTHGGTTFTLSTTLTSIPSDGKITQTITASGASGLSSDGLYTTLSSISRGGAVTASAPEQSFVLDSTAPPAPVVNDGNGLSINGTAEPGTTVTISVGGVVIGTVGPVGADGNWTLIPATPLADGTAVTAKATDAAGNVSPDGSGTVNNNALLITGAVDDIGNQQGLLRDGAQTDDTAPLLTGSLGAPLEAGQSLVIYRDGVLLTSSPVVNGTAWSFADSGLSVANHEYIVKVVDTTNTVITTSRPFNLSVISASAIPTSITTTIPESINSSASGIIVNASEKTTDGGVPVTTVVDPAIMKLGDIVTTTVALPTGVSITLTSTITQGDLNAGKLVQIIPQASLPVDGLYETSTTLTSGATGLVGSAAVNNFTLDATPPVTPSVTNQSVNTLTPVISGTATLAAGETLSVTVNGATYNNVTVTNGVWSIDTATATPSSGTLGAFVNGQTYSVVATATDAAGNSSADTTSAEMVIDTSKPGVVMPEAPNGVNLAEAQSYTGTPLNISLPTGLSVGDTVTSVVTKPGGATLTLTTVLTSADISAGKIVQTIPTTQLNVDGTWSTSTNIAHGGIVGGATPGSFVLDATAPSAPGALVVPEDTNGGVNAAEKTSGNGVPVTVPFTTTGSTGVKAGDTITLTVDDPTTTNGPIPITYVVTAADVAAGQVSILVPTTNITVDGIYNLSATITDVAGNTSGATTGTFTVDTLPPAAPVVTSDTCNTLKPVISGTAQLAPGETLTVVINGATYTNVPVTNGIWTIDTAIATPLVGTAIAGFADGESYNVVATITDSAGNATSDATTAEICINLSAPAVSIPEAYNGVSPSEATSSSGTPLNIALPSIAAVGDTITTTVTPPTVGGVPGTTQILSTTLTAADIAAGTITQIIPASTLTVDGTWTTSTVFADVSAGTTATTANAFVLDAAAPSAPGALVVPENLDGANNVNKVNATEVASNGGVPVTVPLITGGSTPVKAGDTITLTVDDPTTNTPITITYIVSPADITAGNASVLVPTTNISVDGTYNLSATITDTAGNTSAANTGSFIVDKTAPASGTGDVENVSSSDTGSSSTDNITSDTTPTITGTNPADAATVTVTINGTSINATVSGTSWSAVIPAALPDGTYTPVITVTDAAGNATTSNGIPFTIDTTAPLASTGGLAHTSASDTGSSSTDNLTKNTTPALTGTAEANATVEVTIDGKTYVTTATSSGAWTIDLASAIPLGGTVPVALSTGSHTPSIKVTDAAGNSTTANGTAFIVDTTAPSAPSTPDLVVASDSGSSSTDNKTTDTTPTLTFTATPGSTVTVYDGGTPVAGTIVESSSGTFTFTPSAPLAEGVHNFTVTETDAADNTSAPSTSLAVTIDNTAPTVSIAVDDTTLLANQTATLTFTFSEAVSDLTSSDVTVVGGTIGALTKVSDTVYTAVFTPTAGVNSGTAIVSIGSNTFTDLAGNANTAASSVLNLTYDTLVPTTTATFSSMTKDSSASTANADWTTADGSAGRLLTGHLSAALSAGETLKVYANGVELALAPVINGTNWAVTDLNGYNANWTYTAKVVDASGNAGAITSRLVTLDSVLAPVITQVTDTASSSVSHTATTSNALSSVSGTGEAGATIYLYDNSNTNLVGTAVVNASGQWVVTNLVNVGTGSNTFSAIQVDTNGNQSVQSNLWTVTAGGTNLVSNGDFSSGNTGFTSTLANTDGTNPQTTYSSGYAILNMDSISPVTLTQTQASTNYAYGTYTKSYVGSWGDPGGKFSGGTYVGQLQQETVGTIYSSTAQVEAGKTYVFEFDYLINQQDLQGLQVVIDGATIDITSTSSASESGHFNATYVATTNKTVEFHLTAGNTVNGGGDFILDNFNFKALAIASDGSLVAAKDLNATPNSDALTYTSGALDALASNDTITASSTSLQTTLSSGGRISGGAGVDTLVLAAGTTLDLEALTNNQTVKTINEIEVFKLQGNSTLGISANDVLSLGGANNSTMSAYTFSVTTQTAETAGGANVAATGSTSSTNKVQMVINGTSTDKLQLNTLLSDGVAGANGVTGNTDLAGQWAYKGQVVIGGVTYKVYDHSTTNAQVLAEIHVVVDNRLPISIGAIGVDSGVSGSDFITYNQTLTYSGSLPGALADGERVKVEILNGGSVVYSGYATSTTTGWSWDDTAQTLVAGTYTIKTTIVDATGNLVAGYGSKGTATRLLTVDTTESNNNAAPTVEILAAGSDAYINTTEIASANTVAVKASFDNTKVSAGDQVVFNDGTTTQTVTLTAADIANGYATTLFAKPAEGTLLTVTALIKDVAGNTTPQGTDSATLDTTAPAAPGIALATDTGSSNSDGITKDTTLNVTGLEAGATWQYSLDGGSTWLNGTGTSLTLPQGSYAVGSIQVKQTDAAGNVGPAVSNTSSITIDTTAPTVGTGGLAHTSISDTGISSSDSITTNTTPALAGTTEPNATVAVIVNGVTYNTTADASGNWSIAATETLLAGTYTPSITVTDAAGNSATADGTPFTVDLTAPAKPSAPDLATASDTGSSSSDNLTNDTTPTLTGTAESGSLVKVYDGSIYLGSAIASGGTWSFTPSTSLLAGEHTISVTATDAAGNTSDASEPTTITIDTTPPSTTVSFSSMTKDTSATTLNADWTTADGSAGRLVTGHLSTALSAGETLKVYANGVELTNAPVINGTNWEITDLNAYGSSAWTYTAKVFDNAANAGTTATQAVTRETISTNTSVTYTTVTTDNVYADKSTARFLDPYFTTYGALDGYYDGNGFRMEYNIWGQTNNHPAYFVAKDFVINSVKFWYFDMQTSSKTVTYYDVNNVAISSKTLSPIPTGQWGYTVDSGVLARPAAYFKISGGDYDYYTIYGIQMNTTKTTYTTVTATSGADTFNYTSGSLDTLGGNDIVNVPTNIQTILSGSARIVGGGGVDTINLAAGTTLNLSSLTNNQTVKPIQEVEVFEMHGTSSLTLSVNDVLSLGGANLSGYSFSSGSLTSSGKVQLVVKGTGTDTLALRELLSDGVGGNTGLGGTWSLDGTISIGSDSYKVYNHSTTQAQVLVKSAIGTINLLTSPIVLDLNQDGAFATQQVLRDVNGDGLLDQTTWANSSDGVLVWDKYADGQVRDASQYAFTQYGGKTDLEGLRLGFDSNGDAVFDAQDAKFAEFAVWQDLNGDGVSNAGEVRSLAEWGVTSMALTSNGQLDASQPGMLIAGTTTAQTSAGAMSVADAEFSYQGAAVSVSSGVLRLGIDNLSLDLSQVLAHGAPLSTVDLCDAGANTLRLNLSDVLGSAAEINGVHQLAVNGDAADTVVLKDAAACWTVQTDAVSQNGHVYTAYVNQVAQAQLLVEQGVQVLPM